MKKLITFILSVGTLALNAQLFNTDDYNYTIVKTNETITVDGILNEPAWNATPKTSNFWQHYPVDTAVAIVPTTVKITYNNDYLYVSAWCYEENPEPVIQNLVRDDNGPYWSSDGFSFTIDPTNSNQVGYHFAMNAAGAKQDGVISQQSLQPTLDMYWNIAWEGEVTYDENGYYYEFAIPFSAIKYNTDITTWGINFIRNDMKRNVFDMWTKFSPSYNGLDFNFNGEVKFNDGLPKNSGKRFELKPSVSASASRNIQNNEKTEYSGKAGLDAKCAVTENLNLDVALLPDYSTVEVDKQYIDFYRYEYKVAEQREFFLENNDLFASPGSDEDWSIIPFDAYRVKPFYTRRIGIKNWQHTPISYGARLSGNVTEDLRVGLLNMQTKSYNGDLGQNYSAFAFKQSVFKKSSISALMLNRSATGTQNGLNETNNNSEYNRNAGLEYDYTNKKGTLTASIMGYHSFDLETTKNANFYGSEAEYRTKMFRSKSVLYQVEDNYITDMGYVPRLYHNDALNDTTYRIGYTEFSNYTNLIFYPAGTIGVFQLNSKLNTYYHANSGLNEIKYQLGAFIETSKRSSLYIGSNYSNFDMLYANDVLKNNKPLPNGNYTDLSGVVHVKSSQQHAIMVDAMIDYGKFYNGTKLRTASNVVLRAQPWGVFTFSHDMFKYKLPEFNMNDTYHLIGGRAEINFSRDFSWTTLVQYNTQIDNMNVNSMVKWRFKPLSDIQLVVKDDTDLDFNQKHFQVVAKLSYWFKI